MTASLMVDGPVLAIELSQRTGGVALIEPRGGVQVIEVRGGRRDEDELAPAIATVLAAASVDAASLAGIVVDVGPGGFTGLRVSIATAQALAETVGAAVAAVPGALVAAASTAEARALAGRLLVLSAAKAGTAWGTILTRSTAESPWRIEGQPGLLSDPGVSKPDLVLADEHVGDDLRNRLPGSTPVVPPRFDPVALGRLALAGSDGLVVHDDPACLRPLYPREPEAVRMWRERRSDKSSASAPGRAG